jgi:hypothetical protein
VAKASSRAQAIFSGLESRLQSACDEWRRANAAYINARLKWDFARAHHMAEEYALYLAFAEAKVQVKAATDAYYEVVNAQGVVQKAISTAKTAAKLAEQKQSLKDSVAGLIGQK